VARERRRTGGGNGIIGRFEHGDSGLVAQRDEELPVARDGELRRPRAERHAPHVLAAREVDHVHRPIVFVGDERLRPPAHLPEQQPPARPIVGDPLDRGAPFHRCDPWRHRAARAPRIPPAAERPGADNDHHREARRLHAYSSSDVPPM
jgi:hypothetical protein